MFDFRIWSTATLPSYRKCDEYAVWKMPTPVYFDDTLQALVGTCTAASMLPPLFHYIFCMKLSIFHASFHVHDSVRISKAYVVVGTDFGKAVFADALFFVRILYRKKLPFKTFGDSYFYPGAV